ncbi:MAG: translation initiation factor IF-2 [Minisyncoccia bacterium]
MEEIKENKIKRAPIVVVMGHIDHGKSSLLEKIREDLVITKKEAGGITQHIGAYEIEKEGKKITFLDTPGHEAFFNIRKRGAKIADIGILVIDATEGVKEQTKEAYFAAKEANLLLIVALNKIDKPEAQPEIVKNQLAEIGLLVEDRGGDVPCVNVSAKTGQGIDTLLDLIFLLSEIKNLTTEIDVPAEGVVIETCLDARRGPVATLILEKGILRENKILGTSTTCGKIRSMEDFKGNKISEAFPSQPVVVLGFEECLAVGDRFKEYQTIEEAKENIKPININQLFTFKKNKTEEGKKVCNLILKADVIGSLEAISFILEKLPKEEVNLCVLKTGIGNVTIDDVKLANENKAKIFAFRVNIDSQAQQFLKMTKTQVKTFEVIYDLVEDLRREIEKILIPEVKKIELGTIKIIAIFKQSKNRQIVGGKIIEGEVERGCQVEILRENEKIGNGKIVSLQIEKKNIEKAQKGKEVGMLIESQDKINLDDILKVFKEEKRKKEVIF